MYLSTSSAVMPIPLSEMEMVLASLFSFTWIDRSPISPFTSPIEARVFSFWEASTALLINSLRNISWSLYKNFLIMGKIFSVCTRILPFCIIGYFSFAIQRWYHLKSADRMTGGVDGLWWMVYGLCWMV